MSIRNQKRNANHQETTENVSEIIESPVLGGGVASSELDVLVPGRSKTKLPRIEYSILEDLRASLKDKLSSEIEGLLLESQRELLKTLKPKTRNNPNEGLELNSGNESRTPT